ncbi:MAG TPA: TIGR02186 family protein [Devosia sp.]|nr:TIGR02186 family protein [Devosia sp.]
MRALLLALALMMVALPAQAERLVSGVSRPEVLITSSFDGETLTLFGNIEPDAGADPASVSGPYHVVIAVTGPLQNRVARRKSNFFGIWLNSAQVLFEALPSYFHVISDTKLTNITNEATLSDLMISPTRQAQAAAQGNWYAALYFSDQIVRLMDEAGRFGVNEQGVLFRSNTFYSAQVVLQSDVQPGPYLAHTYLFKDGKLVAERSEGFSVRKSGFERFLGLAAVQQPLLYGICAVLLALFTGWLGGVVFRR